MNPSCFAYVDGTLNTTALMVLQYSDVNSTTNASDPVSADWSDVLRSSCIDLDDGELVPLVVKDAPTHVDAVKEFTSAFGTIVSGWDDYGRFFINDTSYINYIYQPFLNTVHNGSSINSTNVAVVEFDDDTWTGDIIINNADSNLDRECPAAC